MLNAKPVIHLNEPQGSFLLNLALFPTGPDGALSRIPAETAGIYAWFRSFHYPSDPDSLYEALMADIVAPKFQPRRGAIKPFYEVEISSKSWFSEGKTKQLQAALRDPLFRDGLLQSLRWSVLFQAPLYIGKSINLRQRIKSHLSEGSPLSERLRSVQVDIKKSLLLIVPNQAIDVISPENTPSPNGDAPDSELESPYDTHELLYEEIFSRLFSPLFTLRIG